VPGGLTVGAVEPRADSISLANVVPPDPTGQLLAFGSIRNDTDALTVTAL
jgi:hypothetical protein